MNPTRWKRVLINAFILLNISAVLLGSSHIATVSPQVKKFFFPYLRWTRLLQGWLLFVPQPRRYAMKYRMDLVFQDGSRESWMRPYPPLWDFSERHLAYHFQKFDLASNSLERYEYVRRDYCQYVARVFTRAGKAPFSVTLVRAQALWPEPVAGQALEYDETKLDWSEVTLATYRVERGVLQ